MKWLILHFFCLIEDDSTKGTIDLEEQEQPQEILTNEYGRREFQFSDSAQAPDDSGKFTPQLDEGKLRNLSGRVFSCQGKNLRIKIPMTTPSRTLSALTYLFLEDFGSQSKKYGLHGGKFSINKSKIHHAEKMIRGACTELYKGLGYLKSYR